MQQTSETYRELLATHHKKETRLAIGETGRLITKSGDAITFGGVRILVAAGGPEGGFGENLLFSLQTESGVFSEERPGIGNCIAAQLHAVMQKPYGTIPRQARIVPYVRLAAGDTRSEWIQKGVFYIDTRDARNDGSSIEKIEIHAYDDMMKAEQDYPSSKLEWPATDISVVREIADFMGVSVDPRTVAVMTDGYLLQMPTGYSCREVLGYIAAMYAGNFVMSDLGELLLLTINGIPAETRYLVTNTGAAITFGGVRILV